MTPSARLRILHLEDDPGDAALVAAALEAGGVDAQLTVANTREQFERVLRDKLPDIVLSDYSMPGYDGVSGLKFVRTLSADLPYILVTGTIGDERAADALRAGATDFVLKDRLSRLGAAVRRALDEARERKRRRELEEQLRQSQKMEAVGQLTGGIAHDFNNILTVIIASAELVSSGLHDDQDELRADLDALLAAGVRGKEMIRKLLGFSRRQPIEPVPLDVAVFLDEVGGTLHRLLPANITVKITYESALPRMRADAGSLEQMVLNLATNARDAMEKGGVLTLHASLAVSGDAGLERHGAPAGRYIRLAVQDTGEGMTEEVLQHVFEPFFTTKPPDKGTGLGMAMIYGLAQQQHGFVDAASQPGKGTTISLYLPVAEGSGGGAPSPEPAKRTSGATKRSATVLIADDEPTLRRAARRSLEKMGYTVLLADNGRTALEQLLAANGGVDLVMTDQMMPDFSGADLYREARKAGVKVPFLVTSGYAPEELAEKGFGADVKRLMKPWTVEELRLAVQGILERD